MDHSTPDGTGAPSTADPENVIHLQQDWTALRGAAPLAQVEAYWYALRGTRLVPKRSDVDPRGIESALSHAFIIERIAPTHARIRIAGAQVSDLMGMEVRGMPLSALLAPEARGTLQRALRGLFDDPAVQKLSLHSERRIGKPALTGQMALYPLHDDKGAVSRALGCIATDGEIGRAPRRFDIVQTRRQVLRAERLTKDTDAGPTYDLPEPALAAAAAEPGATFENTAVPWLRLVRDAKT